MTHRISDSSLFSGIPTEEQLYEWGYREWMDPIPTPAELLERAKQDKIAEIISYDQSTEVNDFIWNGEHMWIDYNLRNDYLTKVQSAKRLGYTSVPFLGMEIPVDTAQRMIDMVNVYAMRCTAVTDAHKAAVEALDTVEAVEAYDYTVGYPDKINFDNIV